MTRHSAPHLPPGQHPAGRTPTDSLSDRHPSTVPTGRRSISDTFAGGKKSAPLPMEWLIKVRGLLTASLPLSDTLHTCDPPM